MKRIILWIIFLPVLLFLLLQLYFFVQICWWVKFNPSSTSFMRHQLEVLQGKNPKAQLQHKWVPYDRISNNLKRAVISSEDDGFSEHEGVDWEAMQRIRKKAKWFPAALPSPSNWPKTFSSQASAAIIAKARN